MDTEPSSFAIMAGEGSLPRMIAETAASRGQPYRVVEFEGLPLDWAEQHPRIDAVYERMGRLFRDLRKAGCSDVTFAGGMTRPEVKLTRLDWRGVRWAPKLISAMKGGDDQLLRAIADVFEAEGFEVVAPHSYLESLLQGPGVLTKTSPGDADRADAARAADIAAAIGAVDVGQGAVVAQGVCLGAESVQGTDTMLEFVASTGADHRHDPEGGKGVLFKGPKPGQDWRMDLPAIGPRTVQKVAAAGLSGVVLKANGVLILDPEETVRAADDLGLFIWSRD